jgi:Family of unknown function (DUF6056)
MALPDRISKKNSASPTRPDQHSFLLLTRLTSVFLLAIPLVLYGYLGTFSRPIADDYCSAVVFRNEGFWGTQKLIYLTWSGRFSSTALIAAANGVGRHLVLFLPGILMICWLAATSWSIRETLRALSWRCDPLSIVAMSELIVLAALASAPDLGQSLYWQTGALTYLTPVILWTLYCGAVASTIRQSARPSVRLRNTLPLFVLALLAAGTSETAAAEQIIAFTAFTVLVIHSKLRTASLPRLVWVGLAGSVVGTVAVACSPGNFVREAVLRQQNGGPLPSFIILGVAVARTAILAMDLVRRTWLLILSTSLILAPQLFVNCPVENRRGALRLAGYVLATSLVVIVISALPAVFALGVPPPDRSLFLGNWILLCSSVLVVLATVAQVLSFHGCAKQPLRGVLVGLGLAGILLFVTAVGSRINHSASGLRRQASAWDSRDAYIRNERTRGNVNVVLTPLENYWPSINSAPLESAGADPGAWVNKCLADYYSINTVVVREGKDQKH